MRTAKIENLHSLGLELDAEETVEFTEEEMQMLWADEDDEDDEDRQEQLLDESFQEWEEKFQDAFEADYQARKLARS